MKETGPNADRQACVVPIRCREGRVEFCLVSSGGDSRWTFPLGESVGSDNCLAGSIPRLLEVAGLEGTVEAGRPLDEFRGSRGGEVEFVTAFLVRVDRESENGRSGPFRRRWCLAEEARLRIRRKPMRRLIDLSLQRIQTPA